MALEVLSTNRKNAGPVAVGPLRVDLMCLDETTELWLGQQEDLVVCEDVWCYE
jgi:hypothetical protein